MSIQRKDDRRGTAREKKMNKKEHGVRVAVMNESVIYIYRGAIYKYVCTVCTRAPAARVYAVYSWNRRVIFKTTFIHSLLFCVLYGAQEHSKSARAMYIVLD